jgi:hypothetical protein
LGRHLATATRHAFLEQFIPLNRIGIDDFQKTDRLTDTIRNSLRHNTWVLDRDDWYPLVAAIKKLRPGLKAAIDALENARNSANRFFDDRLFQTVADEKDAVLLSLEIFGVSARERLTELRPQTGFAPEPFFRQLQSVELREDQIIQHDSHVFPGLEAALPDMIGTLRFANGDEELTVFNANRAKLEETLGVDLIYYNHKYSSFVLVQYKRVKGNVDEWTYRVDDQFDSQLVKMKRFDRMQYPDAPNVLLNSYRASAEMFFFKFCRSVFHPFETGLSQGAYLPIGYLEQLLRSPGVISQQNTRSLTSRNIGRSWNSHQFVDLVREGWIGSSVGWSNSIKPLINACLEGRKSLIVALTQKLSSQHRSGNETR